MQLFLLHFAGGNCYSYEFLKKTIPVGFEFIPLELPGRGRRFEENFLFNKAAAVRDYVKQIRRHRNKQPYIIYGHSMGATLGLSVTKKMEKLGDAPIKLIVSGNAGPEHKRAEEHKKRNRYLKSDHDFKNELRKLGGIPEEVLNNKELFDFFNPIIRADFQVIENEIRFEKGIVVEAPIFALMGSEEEDCDQIENWNRFTKTDFKYQIFRGNHFFIHDYPHEIAQIISTSFANVSINV